jgi:hypothetical protein
MRAKTDPKIHVVDTLIIRFIFILIASGCILLDFAVLAKFQNRSQAVTKQTVFYSDNVGKGGHYGS